MGDDPALLFGFGQKSPYQKCCQTLHYCDTKRNSEVFCICILMNELL